MANESITSMMSCEVNAGNPIGFVSETSKHCHSNVMTPSPSLLSQQHCQVCQASAEHKNRRERRRVDIILLRIFLSLLHQSMSVSFSFTAAKAFPNMGTLDASSYRHPRHPHPSSNIVQTSTQRPDDKSTVSQTQLY